MPENQNKDFLLDEVISGLLAQSKLIEKLYPKIAERIEEGKKYLVKISQEEEREGKMDIESVEKGLSFIPEGKRVKFVIEEDGHFFNIIMEAPLQKSTSGITGQKAIIWRERRPHKIQIIRDDKEKFEAEIS